MYEYPHFKFVDEVSGKLHLKPIRHNNNNNTQKTHTQRKKKKEEEEEESRKVPSVDV